MVKQKNLNGNRELIVFIRNFCRSMGWLNETPLIAIDDSIDGNIINWLLDFCYHHIRKEHQQHFGHARISGRTRTISLKIANPRVGVMRMKISALPTLANHAGLILSLPPRNLLTLKWYLDTRWQLRQFDQSNTISAYRQFKQNWVSEMFRRLNEATGDALLRDICRQLYQTPGEMHEVPTTAQRIQNDIRAALPYLGYQVPSSPQT